MLFKISQSLGLLLISSTIKGFIVFILALSLILRWKKQEVRYWTDFPLLMGLVFLTLTFAKFVDMFLYYYMRNQPDTNIMEASLDYIAFLGRFRFFITYLTVAPIVVLMLIIWFNRKKWSQIAIYSSWTILCITGIFISNTLTHFLILNIIIFFIPVLISIGTYLIMHMNKKMGMINNKLLTIGWSLFIITQIMRPLWQSIGGTILGYLWVSELLETIPYTIIWLGFRSRSKYYKNSMKKVIINQSLENSSEIVNMH